VSDAARVSSRTAAASAHGHPAHWAWACFAVLLLAYASTLPTTITDADAGEFLVIAKTGGVAHPPGYPLFVLICRALSVAEGLAPLVTLVAGFSALCVAAAGALLVRALHPLIDARATACAVVLALLSPAVWRQANAAEPFGLNLLLAAAVVTLGMQLLTTSFDAPARRVYAAAALLGLCFGLGAANHHTLALLAPFPVLVALRWRSQGARVWTALAVATGGFVVGCSPMLALLAANHSAPLVYGDWESSRLIRHVLRVDYGTLSLGAGHRAYGENLWHFLRTLPKHTLFLGPVLLVLGIAKARTWSASARVALVGSAVLAGPVFLALMNIPPDDEPVVVARFFALPMLLLVPWFALGITTLLSRPKWNRPVALLLPLVLLVQGFTARRLSDRSSETVYEQHITQMLLVAGRPDLPLLVSASDLEDYGLEYGKHVLGLAPKAAVVMLGPFRAPWYRERLAKQFGMHGAIGESGFVPLLETLNRANVLFVVDAPERPRPPMFSRARPLGGLLVVIPEGAPMPSWKDIYEANVQVLDELSIVPPARRTTPLSGWELRLMEQHRSVLAEVCAGLRGDGIAADAQACDVRVAAFDAAMTRLGTTRW
jgi:hypothetical protein